MNIDLNKQELSNLVSYCDLAVRQGGLQQADVALPLARKLMAALNTLETDTDDEASDKPADARAAVRGV